MATGKTATELLNEIFDNRHKDDWGVLVIYPEDAERLKRALEGVLKVCHYAPHDSNASYEVEKDDVIDAIIEALDKPE